MAARHIDPAGVAVTERPLTIDDYALRLGCGILLDGDALRAVDAVGRVFPGARLVEIRRRAVARGGR